MKKQKEQCGNLCGYVVVPSNYWYAAKQEVNADADFSKWVKPEAIADAIYFYCQKKRTVCVSRY